MIPGATARRRARRRPIVSRANGEMSSLAPPRGQVQRSSPLRSLNPVWTAALLLAAALVAWIVTIDRMWGMDAGPGTDLGGLAWFAGIWVTMMAAMMLPSVAPMALLFAPCLPRASGPGPGVRADLGLPRRIPRCLDAVRPRGVRAVPVRDARSGPGGSPGTGRGPTSPAARSLRQGSISSPRSRRSACGTAGGRCITSCTAGGTGGLAPSAWERSTASSALAAAGD